MIRECVLGIDTSNYRTSVAAVDAQGNILVDERRLLKVKMGERGLRQSEALFQHVENLPLLFEALTSADLSIKAVSVSNRPRPVTGSYMPCFKAGYGFGKAVAHTLNVPLFEFSHQEGHLEAIKHYTEFSELESFLAWHLSGGTCELLKVHDDNIEIVGGSKDISFGQVIDRVGVLMGMSFPAGEEMDNMALQCGRRKEKAPKLLSKIKNDGLYFNLSGTETQCGRLLTGTVQSELEEACLIKELFDKITAIISSVTEMAVSSFGLENVIFAGGVSCSKYISGEIKKAFEGENVNPQFGIQELSGDNAVGTALLGGKIIWP